MTKIINYNDRDTLQTFQLSNLLHHLTNTVARALKENENTLYYDIKKEVSRYIVADYASLKKTLEEAMTFLSSTYSHGEVILSISKNEKKSKLIFSLSHNSVLIRNIDNITLPTITYADHYDDMTCIKSKKGAVNCQFSIPYHEDKNVQTYTRKLKKILTRKRALFVGKNRNELRIIGYIFESFGIEIEHISPDDFKSRKPNLESYDIALLRSADITPLHVRMFQLMDKEQEKLKIIMMHDIFATKEQRKLALPIAYAEIFRPTIIGDVEEILRKIYIDKTVPNKLCCSEAMKKLETFSISSNPYVDKSFLNKYIGSSILIVDSSSIQHKIIKEILDIDVFKIYTAENGEEAFSLLERKKIDLIFSDINLAELDGYMLAKKIRYHKNFTHIPIIAVTSLSFDHELLKMIDHGFNAHIPVPFNNKHFYTAVHQHLSQGSIT